MGTSILSNGGGAGSRWTFSASTFRPPRFNEVLEGLSVIDRSRLESHFEELTIAPGAVLQQQDHASGYVYFPHEGLIALVVRAGRDRSIEVAVLGREGALCTILQPELRDAFVTAIAQTPLRVSRIAVAPLAMHMAESDSLRAAISACRDRILVQVRQTAVCSTVHTFEQRLARWLLQSADRLDSDIIPATQSTVAERLGVQRTTVTLIASKLQQIDAIRWRRSRVEIVDRAKLEPAACDCYAALRDGMDRLTRRHESHVHGQELGPSFGT